VADLSISVGLISGQMCMASSRVYVSEEIAEKFIAKYKEVFAVALKTAIRRSQTQCVVLRYIEMSKKSGEMILGDRAPPEYASDHFIPQTIFLDTPEDTQIMNDEYSALS
jgi:acyl-CoA reductase-like NAD-dependent aldehyde dehydrogenase